MEQTPKQRLQMYRDIKSGKIKSPEPITPAEVGWLLLCPGLSSLMYNFDKSHSDLDYGLKTLRASLIKTFGEAFGVKMYNRVIEVDFASLAKDEMEYAVLCKRQGKPLSFTRE